MRFLEKVEIPLTLAALLYFAGSGFSQSWMTVDPGQRAIVYFHLDGTPTATDGSAPDLLDLKLTLEIPA